MFVDHRARSRRRITECLSGASQSGWRPRHDGYLHDKSTDEPPVEVTTRIERRGQPSI